MALPESYLAQFVQYVINTRGVTTKQFDEDWEPIGPKLREALVPTYIEIIDDKMMPTGKGLGITIQYAL